MSEETTNESKVKSKSVKKVSKLAVWKVFTVLLAVLFIGAVVANVVILTASSNSDNTVTGQAIAGTSADAIGAKAASEKAVNFINDKLLNGQGSAELVSYAENRGLYEVNFTVDGQAYTGYATLDGKLFFPQSIDLDMVIPEQPAQPAQPAQEPTGSCDDIDKLEKPVIEAWVVSRCPFGTQMMNSLARVYELMGDKVDVIPKYIGNVNSAGVVESMHGAEETAENIREICIREEQPDVLWAYLRCYIESGKTTECEATANVDSDTLQDCVDNRGNDYLVEDAKEGNSLGVTGSPTLFVNGKKTSEYAFDPQNGRSPNNLKNIACCGMTEKAEECDTELPTSNPPRGFGVIPESEASAATGAADNLNCG